MVCEDDTNPCTDTFCDPELGCQATYNTAACTTDEGESGTCSGGSCVPNATCERDDQACSSAFCCDDACSCLCFESDGGANFCAGGDAYGCPAVFCDSTSDCPAGEVCTFTCCVGGDGKAGNCRPACGVETLFMQVESAGGSSVLP